MKNFIKAFALVLLAASYPAFAGWNIIQKGDGSAVWQDSTGREAHVAETYLTVLVSGVSNAHTTAVAIPIAGKIETIYATVMGNLTGAASVFDFWVSTDGTGTLTGVTTEVTNATSRLSILPGSGSEEGDRYTFTPTSNNTVTKGGVLHIHTDGGSTGGLGAYFTIIINPGG